MNLAEQVLRAAQARGVRIATAESCTGGMVAVALTEIAGSSAVMDRAFVTYSNDAKTEMLGVPKAMLDAHGAVSEQVAVQMAKGARDGSCASLVVSITGIAGPGGSDFKPEGRVCFGLAFNDMLTSETVEFGALGRPKVRDAACHHALDLLLNALAV